MYHIKEMKNIAKKYVYSYKDMYLSHSKSFIISDFYQKVARSVATRHISKYQV